jgi:hypothetical protein
MVKVDEDYDKQLRIALDLTVVEDSPLRDRAALDVGVNSSIEHRVSQTDQVSDSMQQEFNLNQTVFFDEKCEDGEADEKA